MSLTKRYIEEEAEKGNDVLHPDNQSPHDYNEEWEYEKWCYYSGMPSPKAYEKKVEDEISFFKESVAKTFDLYLLILGLLKAIKQYVDNQLIAYNKHQIIKDEKYLKLKYLSENRFLDFINNHSILQKHLKNKIFIRWDLEFVFMKDLVEEMISKKVFETYLNNKKPSEKDDLQWLIKSFKNLNVIGADIVELAPNYDQTGVSTATACKVMRELLLSIL